MYRPNRFVGRTARIGNRGLATTFFNDSNSRLGADLRGLLEEAAQEIPEFLEQYKDGATTQAEKRFDALDHHEELGKHGTDIFSIQAAGAGSWNAPTDSSSGLIADDGWGFGSVTKIDDGWGANTPNAGSSW